MDYHNLIVYDKSISKMVIKAYIMNPMKTLTKTIWNIGIEDGQKLILYKFGSKKTNEFLTLIVK